MFFSHRILLSRGDTLTDVVGARSSRSVQFGEVHAFCVCALFQGVGAAFKECHLWVPVSGSYWISGSGCRGFVLIRRSIFSSLESLLVEF